MSKESLIKKIKYKYKEYICTNGYLSEENIYSTPVIVMCGYFLTVHSKQPVTAVQRYLNRHSIPYDKAKEVKMLLCILDN